MDFNALIPVLDAVSKALEGTPVPWLVFAGVALGSLVAVFKQWKNVQTAKGLSAEVVKLPVASVADAAATAVATETADHLAGAAPAGADPLHATVIDIATKTLKP
jgi:hypothetical protein